MSGSVASVRSSSGPEAMRTVKTAVAEVIRVIATQNPSEHHGTYPLPESQRDRFALRITPGHASAPW